MEWFKVAFLFFIYQILSSVVNGGNLDSMVRAFGFIKFIALTMTLLIIFELNYKNFLNFMKILFAVALFIIIDSIFQFSTGQNLFGNQYTHGRLTSIFGDEMIVGAFLTKIGFLLVILPILIFRHFKFNEILVFLIISLLLTTILLVEKEWLLFCLLWNYNLLLLKVLKI